MNTSHVRLPQPQEMLKVATTSIQTPLTTANHCFSNTDQRVHLYTPFWQPGCLPPRPRIMLGVEDNKTP